MVKDFRHCISCILYMNQEEFCFSYGCSLIRYLEASLAKYLREHTRECAECRLVKEEMKIKMKTLTKIFCKSMTPRIRSCIQA